MDTVSQLAACGAAKSLSREHIAAASVALVRSEADVLDHVAVYLAQGFLSGRLSFEFCDAAVVHLMGIYNYGEIVPDLAWEIWSAFDDGEWVRPEDAPDSNPQERHTRPALAEILQRHVRMS